MRTQLVITHALLSDPDAHTRTSDPTTTTQGRHPPPRPQPRPALERFGYKVTLEAVDTGTGELLPVTTTR